jgi:hypothetical protein
MKVPMPKLFISFVFLLLLTAAAGTASAQRIVYSQPSTDDNRRMNFEIIGKVGGNFLVYKSYRNRNFIGVYNNDMVEMDRVEQDHMPDDRLINIDFFPYADFSYMVYQFQRRNVVYCNAVKINGSGKRVSEVMTLDTTHLGFSASNRIYSTISNENKSRLMVFKINSRDKSRLIVTTVLFDNELQLLKRSRFSMPMESREEYLDKFNLDNDGDLVFSKFTRTGNENIETTNLLWKRADSDTLQSIPVPHDKMLLDELHIKVDNANNRYFLTSFYYTKKRGNIEGFYFFVWDKNARAEVLRNAVVLSDELRNEAKGAASAKTAFNDNFVRNVIVKKSGGFLISTETYYTTSRGNTWNRWNYLYPSPWGGFDYYNMYSPYNSWYWRDRFNTPNVRHHSDNITVLSFDNTGKMEWSGVIHKSQFDDESDDRVSHLMANTGSQLHFLFNVDERRTLLLNDYTLSPGGQVGHNPTLKNLDRGYEFLPKYGKQVSANQLIVPCYYRNYICFAKIEFN